MRKQSKTNCSETTELILQMMLKVKRFDEVNDSMIIHSFISVA